jgi:hypothetical protein
MKKTHPRFIFLVHQKVREKKGLLHYKKHVENYMKKLFVVQKQCRQTILAYQILDDTVYFLIAGNEIDAISKFLQHLHGVVAADYAKIKDREGPFWSRRPQYTLIQKGAPFLRCLSLLIRLPVKKERAIHSADWPHSSFSESISPKKRYRILSEDVLVSASGLENYQEFTSWLIQDVETNHADELTLDQIGESVAFGEHDWILTLRRNRHNGNLRQDSGSGSSSTSLLSGSKNSKKYLEEILPYKRRSY